MRVHVFVIKEFPYLDGAVSRMMLAGTEVEVDGDHVDGLLAGGFIAAASLEDDPAVVEGRSAELLSPLPSTPIAAAPKRRR